MCFYAKAIFCIFFKCNMYLFLFPELFALAHNLVDLYPDLAVSWFAVGCYYHTIGGMSVLLLRMQAVRF